MVILSEVIEHLVDTDSDRAEAYKAAPSHAERRL
jgi:hypothetical protein